jgi:hypothetical protein
MLAVTVLDNGISNSFNNTVKRSIFEHDYVFNDNETDSGAARPHGTIVADAVVRTNAKLDLIDARVADSLGVAFSTDVEKGLQGMIALADQGYRIGAINYSYGSLSSLPSAAYQDEIDSLAARGIFMVSASGNAGTRAALESPDYPAALSNVIAVGSHNGSGIPSGFSQQGRGRVVVLADGEDFPGAGESGTSYAAPQVAATVATVQGTYLAATGETLTFNQVIDVLQQGGHGPLSAPDPADNATRYFLLDHNGSVNYAIQTYVDPNFSPYEYLASYGDLRAAFGLDGEAARAHFFASGVYEGRVSSFDALAYTASYGDLRSAFGTNLDAAAIHYITSGQQEGRHVTFDPNSYLDANPDLTAAFGSDARAASRHYIEFGSRELRSTSVQPTSEGGADFASSAGTSGRMVIGASATGTISSGADADWYRIKLTAGQGVVIDVKGRDSGAGTLTDPIVYVHNSAGSAIASDDDSGTGLDSHLVFTPATSGYYFIDVDGFGSIAAGTYRLSVARPGASSSHAAALQSETGEVEAEPATLNQPDHMAKLPHVELPHVELVGVPSHDPVDGYLLT